jgi:hypothetical protein
MPAFQPQSEALEAWLAAIPADPDALTVEPSTLWLDLDGIIGSASAFLAKLRELLDDRPSWDTLESFLIDSQVKIEHLQHHWTHLIDIPGMEWLKELASDSNFDD